MTVIKAIKYYFISSCAFRLHNNNFRFCHALGKAMKLDVSSLVWTVFCGRMYVAFAVHSKKKNISCFPSGNFYLDSTCIWIWGIIPMWTVYWWPPKRFKPQTIQRYKFLQFYPKALWSSFERVQQWEKKMFTKFPPNKSQSAAIHVYMKAHDTRVFYFVVKSVSHFHYTCKHRKLNKNVAREWRKREKLFGLTYKSFLLPLVSSI